MVNRDNDLFRKVIENFIFMVVHNVQTLLMPSVDFIFQREIAAHPSYVAIVKLRLKESIHKNTFFYDVIYGANPESAF